MAQRTWQENNPKSDDDTIWDKEKEPILEGKLAKVENNVGPNESTLYTIEKDDGTEVKVWGSTVLDDRFLGVPAQTYVKITYEGLVKGKNGKSYHNYKVYIDADSMPDPEVVLETKNAHNLPEKDNDEEIPIDQIPF